MEKHIEKKQLILSLLKDESLPAVNEKELLTILEVPEEDYKLFFSLIDELIEEGLAVKTRRNKIMLAKKANLYVGTFESNSNGFGFVRVDGEENDIFIPKRFINNAMHKDKVLCKVTLEKNDGKKREGEIVKVLEKGKKKVVGVFQKNKSFGFVIADDKKYLKDIFISKKNCKNAVTGHKVLVEITKTPSKDGKNSKPEGKIIEILGHINDPGVDILSIVHELEIPTDFPKEVYNQIESIPTEVQVEEYKDRTDMRNIQMVTIDGEDAKDLDDAIHIQKLENGNYLLGVHIADVTHYVKEGSPLDKEALLRGTSVYLVDRVIPMLPHKLSNGICSLNAEVERLALSCDMEIDDKGKVVKHKIYKSLIKINKRMSYTVVNDLLTNENSQYLEENKAFIDMFKIMEELREILLQKRINRGAIEFDFPEAKIKLDKYGKPIDIVKYERNIATSIIEEFMLACNETVAEEYHWLNVPFVFRSHATPDPDKMEKLKDFIQAFGYYLKGQDVHSKSIQKLLSKIGGTEEETIISRLALRSMKQARYTPTNDGHFGLAANYYCHFTSPIRRYPDLQIHRIIKENISNGFSPKYQQKLDAKIPEVCKMCSENERRAEQAEREVSKLKKVEFMANKIGQQFDGVISSVTSWGIYVELSNTVEGMVSVNTLEDDYYIFDNVHLKYFGEKTNKQYGIGQKVKIEVKKANIEERTLDFIFVEELK